MKSRLTIALLTTALPCMAVAQATGSYECSLGDELRRVEILTEPGATVPCEVHYYKNKDAPDEKQVLWRASNQEGYCESKTEEFIAKLEGWGWDCGQGGASMPDPESTIESEAEADIEADAEEAAMDDTDNLLPSTD